MRGLALCDPLGEAKVHPLNTIMASTMTLATRPFIVWSSSVPPMARGVTSKAHWKEAPDDHDYPAAEEYLSLVTSPAAARRLARRLRGAPIVHRKAKDLLRASGLPLLAPDNFHVAKDLKKVTEGRLLSPVLLVRGKLQARIPLTVADGYHRICASYHLGEDADIPCRIADLDSA